MTPELMKLTYAIKRGDRGRSVSDSMRALADALVARGAEAILIACTEIPLVLASAGYDLPVVSSTEALAQRTVSLARGDLPLFGE